MILAKADRMKTAKRMAIQRLYRKQGIQPCPSAKKFGCPQKDKCFDRADEMEFYTGTRPYIGAHYGEAKVWGRSIRVLFVAMDRGGKGFPKRFANTQGAFRTAAEEARLKGHSNAHMGGTSQLMECLVKSKNCFQQFALTNAVKCVARTGRMDSMSNATRKKQYREHLRKEIKLLCPHLVITQGGFAGETVLKLFQTNVAEKFSGPVRGKAEVRLSEFVILTTPHPARMPGWKWKLEWKKGLPKFLQKAVERARIEVRNQRHRS
jgi:hypothetical protein